MLPSFATLSLTDLTGRSLNTGCKTCKKQKTEPVIPSDEVILSRLADFQAKKATDEELRSELEALISWRPTVQLQKGDDSPLYKDISSKIENVRDILRERDPPDREQGYGESQFFGQDVDTETSDDDAS